MGSAQKTSEAVEGEPESEPEAVTAPSTTDDLMNALLESVRKVKHGAADTASRSKHAVDLAFEIFGHRVDLASALYTIDELRERDEHELFLREVERAYYRNAESLAEIDGRVDLVSRWLDVLLVALRETQRVLDDADEYRRGDPGISPESREAVRRKAAERWHRVA